jgi:hypothetical protein
MNDIIIRNRNLGLETVLQMAEERAPNGFANISDVLSQDELETTASSFKRAAGISRPSTAGSPMSSCGRRRDRRNTRTMGGPMHMMPISA